MNTDFARRPTCRLFQVLTASPRPLVIAAVQTPSHRKQLELWVRGHQAFGRIEHIDGMATVAGHRGHTDARPSIQVLRPGLGGRHAELALQLGDNGTDHRSLLFE